MNTSDQVTSNPKSYLDQYWAEIGGWEGITASRYWKYSNFFALLCFPLWIRPGWWEIAISVTGTALGFSVGALGVLYSALPQRLRASMAKDKENGRRPVLLRVALQFFHFILSQVVALAAAVISKAWFIPEFVEWTGLAKVISDGGCEWAYLLAQGLAWYVPFMLFCYAVACTLNSVIALGRIVRLEIKQANSPEKSVVPAPPT